MKQKITDAIVVALNALLMFFFPFHPMVMFAIGYTARHIIQHAFDRTFKKKALEPLAEISASDLKDSIMSFDGGKTWFVRPKQGEQWVSVQPEFIQQILNHYASTSEKIPAFKYSDTSGNST